MSEKSLIVGVDGSDGSRAAVDEAIDLAGNLGAALTFVFVCKPPARWLGDPYYQRALTGDLVDARRAVAEAVEKATTAGIEADAEILEGDPANELVSIADNRDADLIVVGSRGHGALAGAVLGSVSKSVSQHANRTVVVAKQMPARKRLVAVGPEGRPRSARACMDIIVLVLAATATALATGLGAIPVFFLGGRAEKLRPVLLGTTVGLMTVAALVGLLRPALQEGGAGSVLGGLIVGVAFLVVVGLVIDRPRFHEGRLNGPGMRLSVLVFAVLLVHSLPEGFAIGTAYASDRAGLSLFVILAIGLQNIPEGTSVAIPMEAAGFRRSQQFWAAVLTSAPQPAGRSRRLPARRACRGAPALLVRLRRRRHARPGRRRARSAGLCARKPAPGRPRGTRRRRAHAPARRGLPHLALRANPSSFVR